MHEEDTLLDNGHRERRDQKTPVWVVLFVTVSSLAMSCYGLFISITGPTLQFLAVNTDSRIDQVSVVLVVRSVGVFVGAIIFSALSSSMKRSHHLWSLSFTSLALGALVTVTPFLHSRALLGIVQAVGGIMFGYFYGGIEAMYLKHWSEATARPFVQITNVFFIVGAFLAPIIAKPFLEMESRHHTNARTCHINSKNAVYDTDRIAEADTFNLVIWCFVAIGSYVTLVAIIFIVLLLCGIEKKIFHDKRNEMEAPQERPIKEVWVLFILVFMYMFCVSNLMVFQSFIYSTAVCSTLDMNVRKASFLNSLYWIGNIVGSVSGVLMSRYFKPNLIVLLDLAGTSASAIIMSIWGEENEVMMWIFTFLFGFFVASVRPCGVVWSNQVTNMTRKYMFIFFAGSGAGTSVMTHVTGDLFQIIPFSMVYVVAGVSLFHILVFTLMAAYRRYYLEQ